MIDWKLDPETQALFDRVVAETRRLQKELGIEPRTIEQRHQDYIKQQQRQQELTKTIGRMRPPPKWKV